MTRKVIINEGRIRNAYWKPPLNNMVKLNTEGASKDHKIYGRGGISQDAMGDWIGGFSKFSGNCNALRAELWGVYEGLKLTKRLRLMRVEINLDSESLVTGLKGVGKWNANCLDLIRENKKLIVDHEFVLVTRSYRE